VNRRSSSAFILATALCGCATTRQIDRSSVGPEFFEQLRREIGGRSVKLEMIDVQAPQHRTTIINAAFTPTNVAGVPTEVIHAISWTDRAGGAGDGALIGLPIGLVVGAISGVLAAHAGVADSCTTRTATPCGLAAAAMGGAGAVVGLALGAGVGAIVGAAVGQDHRIEFR
jgi:hypothetical protein